MSGASRVSIPNNLKKTIQDIKEIAGEHSDEDIYAMLKECSMDPNETAQKLLYLGIYVIRLFIHEGSRMHATDIYICICRYLVHASTCVYSCVLCVKFLILMVLSSDLSVY